MLGMTIDEVIAYTLALRFTRAMKKVVEVQPVYLDDNLYYLDEMVARVTGLNPFKGITRR